METYLNLNTKLMGSLAFIVTACSNTDEDTMINNDKEMKTFEGFKRRGHDEKLERPLWEQRPACLMWEIWTECRLVWVVVEPDSQLEVVLLDLQPLAGVDLLKAQESGKPEKERESQIIHIL